MIVLPEKAFDELEAKFMKALYSLKRQAKRIEKEKGKYKYVKFELTQKERINKLRKGLEKIFNVEKKKCPKKKKQ